MQEIRKQVTGKLAIYVGSGPEQVRSEIAGHILGYSRVQFDRFIHPDKPFWIPEKRCKDFVKFFEDIDKLYDASMHFLAGWNNREMSNEEIYIHNTVYDPVCRRIFNSKKITLVNKTWMLINEILRRRVGLGG